MNKFNQTTAYGHYASMQGVFCHNLKKHLKTLIKGEVKCHIVEDMLIVDIFSTNGIAFRFTYNNIISEIVQGFASETLSAIIVKRYRKYINNLYFL